MLQQRLNHTKEIEAIRREHAEAVDAIRRKGAPRLIEEAKDGDSQEVDRMFTREQKNNYDVIKNSRDTQQLANPANIKTKL